MKQSTFYGTSAELSFIRGLGSHSCKAITPIENARRRVDLLQGYLRASQHRMRWGPIDDSIVWPEVLKQLDEARLYLSELETAARLLES